jgi:hypothetical protein
MQWVRLDAAIASHDKILALAADPSPHRWRAAASYVFSLGWSGAAETDGRIPVSALQMVHGTSKTAALLVRYRLWEALPSGGWGIVNWAKRQPLVTTTEAVRAAQSAGARRANCQRWHGPDCGCWKKFGAG